jgi:hypothetical protein
MTASLIAIWLIFVGIMFSVLGFCLIERKRALASTLSDQERDQRADKRVVIVMFVAVIVGAALALLTAYVVFFRVWD